MAEKAGGQIIGPGYPVDVGFAFNQHCETWASIVHHVELPLEFTALPDT